MINQVKEIVQKNLNNPEAIFDAFFTFYEETACKLGPIDSVINNFPSPLKELIAAHQAWGVIGSDNFNTYLDGFNSDFDKIVKTGLCLLEKESCYIALEQARKYFESGQELSYEQDTNLWQLFYEPIREFELIAGMYLNKLYG